MIKIKYLNYVIRLFIIVIVVSILFGTLSYFNIISDNTLTILQYITTIVTIFLTSFNLGKIKEKKKNIDGVIFGIIIIFLFLIINLLIKRSINKFKLVYYLLLLIVSIFGNYLGTKKKAKA